MKRETGEKNRVSCFFGAAVVYCVGGVGVKLERIVKNTTIHRRVLEHVELWIHGLGI